MQPLKRACQSVKTEFQTTRHKLLKLFWIFLIASLIGAVAEILFVGVTTGRWMSRSGLLYGQFSAIWGLGAVVMTVLLHRLNGKNDRYIFFTGALVGGAYEFLCSWVGEKLFGVIFWDYSEFTFNLAGRVNLLFCLFWGMAAVTWVKVLYPRLSRLVDRFINWKHKTFVTLCGGTGSGRPGTPRTTPWSGSWTSTTTTSSWSTDIRTCACRRTAGAEGKIVEKKRGRPGGPPPLLGWGSACSAARSLAFPGREEYNGPRDPNSGKTRGRPFVRDQNKGRNTK